MGKRKTRQQKKIADLRQHNSYSSTLNNSAEKKAPTFSYIPSSVIAAKKYGTIDSYTYVKHDLMKTTMLSASIIVLQMILLLLLRLHIVHIPYVSY